MLVVVVVLRSKDSCSPESSGRKLGMVFAVATVFG
jgi:hypothetical protein